MHKARTAAAHLSDTYGTLPKTQETLQKPAQKPKKTSLKHMETLENNGKHFRMRAFALFRQDKPSLHLTYKARTAAAHFAGTYETLPKTQETPQEPHQNLGALLQNSRKAMGNQLKTFQIASYMDVGNRMKTM